MTHSTHRLISFDETALFYHRTRPESAPRAILLLVHGMGEHGGRYRPLAEFLSNLGVETWALDLRGFGQSAGKQGHCRQFDEYKSDLEALFRHASQELRQTPIFILGNSFGGLVAAYSAATSSVIRPKGLIFTSPLFGVAIYVPLWQKALAALASVIAPAFTQNNRVDARVLTHDVNQHEERRRDRLIHYKITARLYAQIQSILRQRKRIASGILCPVLLLQAGDDKIVSMNDALAFYADLATPAKEKEVYQSFYHEILYEEQRDKVFSRIASWIVKFI